MIRRGARFLLGIALIAVPFFPAQAAEIAIEGQVLGSDAIPLNGVRVELRPALSRYEAGMLELAGGEGPAPVAQDVTGGLGRFRLNAPRAGLWRLVARADGYVPMELPVFSVLEERNLPAVTLRPDRGLRVRVEEPGGKPVPGIRVLGQTEKAVLWGTWWQPLGRVAVSSSDGSLRLSRAAGEPLRLWAAGPGFPVQSGIVEPKGDAVLQLQRGEGRFLPTREADGRAATKALLRDPSASLLLGGFGQHPLALAAPAVHGRIVDAASGRPIAGALVWASADPGTATWTDAMGTYRLSRRSTESRWWLQAAAAGHATGSLLVGPRPGSSDGPPRVADLALVPAPVPEIAGLVVDEAAKPLAGAEVLLVDPWYPGDPQQSRRVSTSPAGAFRIAPLQAGDLYALTATRSGFAPTTLLVTAQIPSQKLSATRLVLRRGPTVSGLVVDPRQQPISGAAVRLTPARPMQGVDEPQPELGPFLAATGPDGRFQIPHMPAGLFELRIEGPDLAPLPVREISVPGAPGSLDLGTFTVESRQRIAGWIVDPTGQPLEGAEIWVVPDDPVKITAATLQAGPAAVTGLNGRYELRDRGVGDHEHLRACRKGYVPEEFPAKGGASESPRSVLAPTVQLTGRVVGAGGEPLVGAWATARPSGQSAGDLIMPAPPCPFVSSGLADAEGAFTLELAGPGRYDVGASCAGQLSNSVPDLQVPPEGLAGVEIRLNDGATVSGHVADPEGHPIAGASISASSLRSYVAAASDDGGNFLLEGVEPGERLVDVRHDDFAMEERKVQIGPEGTQIQFVLHPVPHLEIRGRVIGPDGAPIAGVLLAENRCRCRSTSTLADGSFLMRVDPGVVELFAEKDGFAPMMTTGVRLEDRSLDGVEIRLSYGLTLTGHVLGIDPAAVGKISVFLTSVALFREAPVDSEGRFEVPNLPSGEWGLFAQAGDCTASEKLTPPDGLTEVVHDLQFPPVSENPEKKPTP